MRSLIAILTLTVATNGALAQQSWVGKTILTKKYNIKIGYTDERGKQVYLGELREPVYKVTGDQGGWLKVTNEQGVSGWFDKSLAVLLDDAPAYFTSVIQKDPGDPDAYYMRAVAWNLKGELDRAIKDLSEALRIDPGFSGAYNERGLLWQNKGEHAKAIADFTQAIRLKPTAANFSNRGYSHRQTRQYEKARADFESALRINPKYVLAYDDLAWLLATCTDSSIRDGVRAVELAKKGLALSPKDASLMDTLAAAYAEIGDFDQAVLWQQRALEDPSWNTESARARLELYRAKEPYRQDP